MRGARALGLALILIAAFGVGSAPACGCGAAFHARSTFEKALVTYHGGTETIIPGLGIRALGANPSVVFPVPSKPNVTALPGNLDPFASLESATTPHRKKHAKGGRHVPLAGAAPPTVVSQKLLGGYTVTVLTAGTGGTLLTWLSAHQYALPAGAKPILNRYAAKHWYFVAIRLATSTAGMIKPLSIAFSSTRIVYPERLSRVSPDPVSLELFVNTDRPATATGMASLSDDFHGRVAALHPALSQDVKALLPAAYLTRFDASAVAPSAIRSDIFFHQKS